MCPEKVEKCRGSVLLLLEHKEIYREQLIREKQQGDLHDIASGEEHVYEKFVK